MTTLTAPLATITLQALLPDVVRSCVVQQPAPPPNPGETPPPPIDGPGIYTPVPPGITLPSLPPVTIIDTSPDQMIGCIISTGTNPQGRLNALFPAAIDGDGVIERNTNDIWVYDGVLWENVGPNPGPTIVNPPIIPPWNEIVNLDGTVRVKLVVQSLPYALEQLTTVPAIGTILGLAVQSARALIRVPAAATTVGAEVPFVTSGAAVKVPAKATALSAPTPQVSSGASLAVPLTDLTFAASMVPYVGTRATVVQPAAGLIAVTALVPQVSSGAAVAIPASDLATAAPMPVVISKPAPTIVTIRPSSGSQSSFIITNVTANQGDILLALVETSGDGTPLAPLPDGVIGGTFQAVTGSPVTDVATAAGSTLQAWWLRCSSSFISRSVTIDDSGNHQLAAIVIIQGCTTAGNPWDVTATDTKTVASTTASAPAVTTTVGNTLVISTVSRANSSISTTAFGTPTNAVLGDFTDRGELGTAEGNGGGFVITSGVKMAPGDTGVTSFASAPNTTNAAITIAFKP